MRAAAAALVLALAACTSASPAPSGTATSATEAPSPVATPTAGASQPSSTPSDPETEVLATDPDQLRFRAPPGASSLVRGAYPPVASVCRDPEQPTFTARYPGTLAIRRDPDGTMSLTVNLRFEEYLEGIAEIPPSWPMAALEAQAIAARSYALASTGWSGQQGATLGTPICATSACQVYRGVPVEPVSGIRRWYRAVRRTEGRVLLSGGRPAETLYFSTSNGRIYGNDEVFGSSPLPYLRPGVERDDGASPLSRWSAAIPLRELRTFLARAGLWPAGRAISAADGNGSSVTVTGPGETRTVDGSAFREAVNTWAPCLRPARYPSGGLPVTVPSRWMTLRSSGRTAVVEGRGWGHGVGMVQWGAYGKARRGFSSERILAFYYGGLRPTPYPEPGLIHVEVAEGLTRLRILATDGATLEGEVLEPGIVTIAGVDELTATGPRAPGP